MTESNKKALKRSLGGVYPLFTNVTAGEKVKSLKRKLYVPMALSFIRNNLECYQV
ncbi:MAG: hypothetical protein GY696_08090 [Gammaproteobacteria bacterium]|nr:hypothetical protein [Gammaproteobacteria bacterium]